MPPASLRDADFRNEVLVVPSTACGRRSTAFARLVRACVKTARAVGRFRASLSLIGVGVGSVLSISNLAKAPIFRLTRRPTTPMEQPRAMGRRAVW